MLATAILTSACSVYKIAPEEVIGSQVRALGSSATVIELTDFPEGAHCFEPMMHFLTLGIIPTHCVERFHVQTTPPENDDNNELPTHYRVTYMQGWLVVPLAFSRAWRFGFGENVQDEILELMTGSTE